MHIVDYFVIAGYFALVMYLGYYSMKKVSNFDDYAVAGRSMPLPIFFAAIAATLCGGGATIGRISFMHTTGIIVFFALTGVVINQIFSGLFISGRVHNAGKNVYSLGDLYGIYYGRSGRLLSSVFGFLFCVGAFGVQILAMGAILQTATGISLIPAALIASIVTLAYTWSGGILAVPVADTIKRADKSRMILETVPRSDLWRAATPQMFRVHDLVEALSGDLAGITDEASAMERLGRPVRIVPGRTTNIKVTEPADGVLASLILGDGAVVPFRVGQGYDSHRLVEGRPLILGGVQIPFELGLDGHSDADVLLHAVTDAVLGAAALGDIGQHFPPSDPKWKGADSRVLLRAVVALARQKGWTVVNCDATIVAERPKIGPHMPAIRASLAETLGVSEEVVNVKAKTNERMDAVGRMEGMMAQAVVLMSRMA